MEGATIEGEATEVKSKPAADVLRALADDLDAGKDKGYVLVTLDNVTGDTGAAVCSVRNVHIAYSLLHDIADKVKAQAVSQQSEQIILPPGAQRQ